MGLIVSGTGTWKRKRLTVTPKGEGGPCQIETRGRLKTEQVPRRAKVKREEGKIDEESNEGTAKG